MARNRRKLPGGWSHPVRPSEVAEIFPGSGHVSWNGRPAGWQNSAERPVFWLTWEPRAAMPQPVLTVWAVPSEDRAAIRRWIEETAAPQAGRWLLALESRSPTWRDTRQSQAWSWKPAVIPGPGTHPS
jgi:hypothetical protein